jgi:hypothetical protein
MIAADCATAIEYHTRFEKATKNCEFIGLRRKFSGDGYDGKAAT